MLNVPLNSFKSTRVELFHECVIMLCALFVDILKFSGLLLFLFLLFYLCIYLFCVKGRVGLGFFYLLLLLSFFMFLLLILGVFFFFLFVCLFVYSCCSSFSFSYLLIRFPVLLKRFLHFFIYLRPISCVKYIVFYETSNMIGQGHWWRFRLKCHLDTSFNSLTLHPLSGAHFN